MTYTLAPCVMAEMLEKEGFQQTIVDMHYVRNYVYADLFLGVIMFLDETNQRKDIQDLISKGYVIVNG